MPSPQEWHWCMTNHSDLWALDLSQQEILAYTYLNSFCHKAYPISLTLMSAVLHMDTKRLKRAIDGLILRNMLTKKAIKGRAALYQITTMRINGWGQLPLPLGANAPTHLGANAPTGWGQTPLLTTYLKGVCHAGSLDHVFLGIFDSHFRKWQFNRKPIGGHFVFTRGMQTKALECMRWLHKNCEGYSAPEPFHAFLDGCGEFLGLDRDVLNHPKDLRACSPGRWLNDWPEQIRLVGIYLEEKRLKITRMG